MASKSRNIINTMRADELRRLHEGQSQNTQSIPAQHSYKYMRYLAQQYPESSLPVGGGYNQLQKAEIDKSLIDNLGQEYNDDSHGQLTHNIPSNAISIPVEPITRWVTLNSEDRDWLNRQDENPYSFAVHLGASSQYQDITGTLRNIELTVNKHFENITRIECSSVIIPNRALSNKFRPSNRPFFLLSLGNVDNMVYGSNKALNTATTVITPKIPIPSDTYAFRHIEYISNSGIAKDYLTPEASINRLYINIMRPDGYNPWLDNAATDIISIKTIYMPSISNNYLSVITDGFFNAQDFQEADIIKFRSYIFRDTTLGYKECNQFNQFINREAGHIIQGIDVFTGIISPPYAGTMYNVIKIPAPGYWNTTTGEWAFPEWFNDPINMGLIQKTSIEDTPIPSGPFDNTGKGLNCNTQTTIVLKISYLDKNAGQLVKKIK